MTKMVICVLAAFIITTMLPVREMGQHIAKGTCLPINNETGGEALTLPPNIVPSNSLRPLVVKLLANSVIFRKQCQTLSQAANFRITIELIHPAEVVCYRALTTFTRNGGQITARIRIVVPTRRFAELLGHEFEHILELLDGVNWKVLSTKKRSGVYSVGENLYETQRAILIGKEVAREYESVAQKNQSLWLIKSLEVISHW